MKGVRIHGVDVDVNMYVNITTEIASLERHTVQHGR